MLRPWGVGDDRVTPSGNQDFIGLVQVAPYFYLPIICEFSVTMYVVNFGLKNYINY